MMYKISFFIMFSPFLPSLVSYAYLIKNSQLSFFIVSCSWVHKHASVFDRTMNVCDHRTDVSLNLQKILNNSSPFLYRIIYSSGQLASKKDRNIYLELYGFEPSFLMSTYFLIPASIHL